MTSPDFQLSSQELQQIATAFAVERQVITPELARSFVDPFLWKIEDKEKIAAGLLLCFSYVIGQTFDLVTIDRIDRIYPPGRNRGLIDFKLVCRLETGTQVDLGVCVLPFSDLELVNEACTRLLVYKDFGLDRLCLLRQSDLMTDVRQLPTCLPKLLSADIGGTFVPLKSKDILMLLTTLSVFQHKQQHELTSSKIHAYLLQAEILIKNELIRNILATAQSL
jgi:hypothetical protein